MIITTHVPPSMADLVTWFTAPVASEAPTRPGWVFLGRCQNKDPTTFRVFRV